MTNHVLIIASLASLCACETASSSRAPDWTKTGSKHYEETVKGVTFALDAPEGRKGRPDTKDTGWDFWLMHERGYAPSISIAIHDRAETLEQDIGYRMAKSEGGIVSTETFANGFAYTEKVRDTYRANVVLHIEHNKSIACQASAGDLPVDPDVAAKLPALEAICRSLDVGGIRLRVMDKLAAVPGELDALFAWPAECEAYLSLIRDLARCDKLAPGKRDELQLAVGRTTLAWSKLTDERKAQLPVECKADTKRLAADAKLCGAVTMASPPSRARGGS